MNKHLAILNKKYMKLKDLYFITYETKDNNLISLLNEKKQLNLFYDIVLISNPTHIKYHFDNINIINIVPAIRIAEIYQKLDNNEKEIIIKKDNQFHLINMNEMKINQINCYCVTKKQLEAFINMLEMIKNNEIEPIYIPITDKEKYISFSLD